MIQINFPFSGEKYTDVFNLIDTLKVVSNQMNI